MRPHYGVVETGGSKYDDIWVKVKDPDSDAYVLVRGQAVHELKEGDHVVTTDYLPGIWWMRPHGERKRP